MEPDEAVNAVISLHARADYMLEMGVWSATCRSCGWRTADPSRRRAAMRFRSHCKDPALIGEDHTEVVVDLREGAPGATPPARTSVDIPATPKTGFRVDAQGPARPATG